MDSIVDALLQKLRGGGAAPTAPVEPLPARPWEVPLSGNPVGVGGGSPVPPASAQPPLAPGQMPGTPQSTIDEALLRALEKARFNNAFAAGTGNPAVISPR